MSVCRLSLWLLAGLLACRLLSAGEPRRITPDGPLIQRLSFAPDGAAVVFARHEGETIRLYRRNLTSGEESRLTDREAPEFDAVYSPDGQSLLLALDETTPNQGNIEVYRLSLADRALTRLAGDVQGLSHEESPCWSPDGEFFAFTSTRDGNQELYVAKADGSDVRRLTSDPAIDAHPAWSPDGSAIAFATNRWGDLEIALIAPDGTNLRRLTDSSGLDDYPAWSPDGTRLAFVSNRTGNLEVFVVDARGGEPVNVTQHPAWDNFPTWTPTGELAFVSDRGGGYAIYVQSAPER